MIDLSHDLFIYLLIFNIFYFFSLVFNNMYKLNRWWSKQLNRVLTHLHTPRHSSGCTSFSALHSCFPFLLTFSIMFLVKFWKRSLMNVPKATNLFLVLELCFGHTVPYTLHLDTLFLTLYTWTHCSLYSTLEIQWIYNMCFILQTRHVLLSLFH